MKIKLSRYDRIKAILLYNLISFIIKSLCYTLEIKVVDNIGVTNKDECERKVHKSNLSNYIWAFWHNRIFVMPYIYNKFVSHRKGYIFTSSSGDGEILAKVMKAFGVEAIRGSSNKRPIYSLKSMLKVLLKGYDLVITPDGPRGPRETLHTGILNLALKSGSEIMPVSIWYSKYIELKTWDRFMIPYPFSNVKVVFNRPIDINNNLQEVDLDDYAERVSELLSINLSKKI